MIRLYGSKPLSHQDDDFWDLFGPEISYFKLMRDLLTMKQDFEENDFTDVYDLEEVLWGCPCPRKMKSFHGGVRKGLNWRKAHMVTHVLDIRKMDFKRIMWNGIYGWNKKKNIKRCTWILWLRKGDSTRIRRIGYTKFMHF